MSAGNDTVEFWIQKCQHLETIIKTLSALCVRVVEKQENLLINYQQNQEQYKRVVQKLKDKGEQVKKAKDVLQPIIVEYQTLKEKYDLAITCQQEAESFASKVNHKNKVLKRQSKMLLNKVGGLNIVDSKLEEVEEDEDSSSPSAENQYYNKLNNQILDLAQEKTTLTAELQAVQEKYQKERERNLHLNEKLEACRLELTQSRKIISQQEEALQQLAQSSEAACREYEELQTQYQIVISTRAQAEKIAHHLHAERDAALRQSTLLLKDVGNDRKLMEALLELETMNKNMQIMKLELESQIKTLEEELKAEKDNSNVKALESENESLSQERDSLLQRLADAESAGTELRAQYTLLTSQYTDLEKKYDNIVHAPPPPPPPPPPLPPVSKTQGLLAKITSGKKKRNEKKVGVDSIEGSQEYSKALKEMMTRIKQGNMNLRPVANQNTKSTEEDGKAIKELQNILNKMKKVQSDEDLTSVDVPPEKPGFNDGSELARAFMRLKQTKREKSFDSLEPDSHKEEINISAEQQP